MQFEGEALRNQLRYFEMETDHSDTKRVFKYKAALC